MFSSPGMEDPVHEVEMRSPVVSEADGHHQVEDWSLGETGEREEAGGPTVTERDLKQAGNEAGGDSHQGVVQDLAGAGVGGRHLVLRHPALERREVEEPVPGPAHHDGGGDVPQEDVRHPVSRELSTATKGGVNQSELSWAQLNQQEVK